MEIVGSGQQYIINANRKLLAENSIDAFHSFPVHSTYFDYLKTIGSLRMAAGAGACASRRRRRFRNSPAPSSAIWSATCASRASATASPA